MKYWQQKAEENVNAGDYVELEDLHSVVCALWRQSISKSNSLFDILGAVVSASFKLSGNLKSNLYFEMRSYRSTGARDLIDWTVINEKPNILITRFHESTSYFLDTSVNVERRYLCMSIYKSYLSWA